MSLGLTLVLVAVAVLIVAGVLVAFTGVFSGRRRDLDDLRPPGSGGSTATLERPPAAPTVAAPPVEADAAEVLEVPTPVRPTFRDRLGKARSALSDYLGSALSRSSITEGTWDELEEALLRADVGVQTTTDLLADVREAAAAQNVVVPGELIELVKNEMKERLAPGDRRLRMADAGTTVWLFVGVNGVGKTTTIGKIGKQQVDEGRIVVMAAGDTFRAAAGEQLESWSDRVGAHIVRGEEGGDPSAIIFDAVQSAASRGADLVLADTAGRLHTKTNLMEELTKVRRVADRDPGSVAEVLLVIDATTGQNGLVQAQQFTEAVDVTGVVLTKLDGSAKGGIVLAIQDVLGIPVKLVGLGESADDLVAFDHEDFVDALFG